MNRKENHNGYIWKYNATINGNFDILSIIEKEF